jgi:hypothetical protein
MDCDQVFSILTRGPFPTGESWDEEVESHLENCSDCWRLAEALRPAMEVFQEAVPAAESRDLPGYWGDARPASAMVAELARSTARAASSVRMQRIMQRCDDQRREQMAKEFSGRLFRAVVLASTLTAAVVSMVLLWWG